MSRDPRKLSNSSDTRFAPISVTTVFVLQIWCGDIQFWSRPAVTGIFTHLQDFLGRKRPKEVKVNHLPRFIGRDCWQEWLNRVDRRLRKSPRVARVACLVPTIPWCPSCCHCEREEIRRPTFRAFAFRQSECRAEVLMCQATQIQSKTRTLAAVSSMLQLQSQSDQEEYCCVSSRVGTGCLSLITAAFALLKLFSTTL